MSLYLKKLNKHAQDQESIDYVLWQLHDLLWACIGE